MKKQSKKKRVGRPNVDNPATKALGSIRITPEQQQDYHEVAKSEGLPLAAWVKRELDRAVNRFRRKK